MFVQAAQFERPPVTLAQLGSRYAGITWANGGLALLDEYWWKTRQVKQWKIAPGHPEQAPVLLHARSEDDRYGDPGEPLLQADDGGRARLQLSADGSAFYRIGDSRATVRSSVQIDSCRASLARRRLAAQSVRRKPFGQKTVNPA